MSTPTIRAALERLLQQLAALRADPYSTPQLEHAEREGRAALAAEPVGQPVSQPYKFTESGDGLTDEELLAMRSWSSYGPTFDSDLVDFARAILARCSRPAAPPAPEPGEVGEVGEDRWYPRFADWLEREMPEGTVIGDPLWWASKIADYLARWGRPAAPPAPEAQRDAVIAAVTEALGNAYDCQRVWEAWSVGTMGQDDFVLVAEDSDRVAEIADAAIEAMLATPPAPEPPAEALAARPLLEQVARLGDCIGANTVGQITAISDRAAAWLRENPPGQPVAIEPRGCPTPGACSCVEPAAPPAPRPEGDWFAVAMVAQDMQTGGRAMQSAGDELLKLANSNRSRPAAPPAPEPGEVGELADRLGWIAAQLGDIGWSDDSASVARAATLLQQLSAPAPAVVPVAVSERPWEREGWCDVVKRCWFLDGNHWILDYPLRLPAEILAQIYSLSLPFHAIPLPQAGEGEV